MPREVITAKTCLSCGACCWSMHDQERYCDVTPEDIERLPKKFVRLNVIATRPFDMLVAALSGDNRTPAYAIATKWAKQTSGPFKGTEACVCAALKGSLMSKVSCTVYKDRPNVCRKAVKPGDRSCRDIRRLMRQAKAED
jgi:Fe-S-cluster containining protein